jgi:hypothetical protein
VSGAATSSRRRPVPPPKKIIRPKQLTITLPEDVFARLELYLTSSITGKVPKGAYQSFWVERIEEYFAKLNQEETTT